MEAIFDSIFGFLSLVGVTAWIVMAGLGAVYDFATRG
jgi:hypothetical protein